MDRLLRLGLLISILFESLLAALLLLVSLLLAMVPDPWLSHVDVDSEHEGDDDM